MLRRSRSKQCVAASTMCKVQPPSVKAPDLERASRRSKAWERSLRCASLFKLDAEGFDKRPRCDDLVHELDSLMVVARKELCLSYLYQKEMKRFTSRQSGNTENSWSNTQQCQLTCRNWHPVSTEAACSQLHCSAKLQHHQH